MSMWNVIKDFLVNLFSFDQAHPLLFTQFYFWAFFALVFAVFSLFHSKPLLRNGYLFAMSLFFYYKTSGVFLALLVFVIVYNFFAAKGLRKLRSERARQALTIFSVIVDLGILAYFKYAYFLTDFVNNLLGTSFAVHDVLGELLNTLTGADIFRVDAIILPVGISFFTFQAVSYMVDVKREKIEPVKNFLDFGFYLSFFPQLVAGPIVRAVEFVEQLHKPYNLSRRWFGIAIFWIMNGLLKKLILSDYLAVNFVDRVFENPLMFSGFENLSALFCYSLQVYADFSGYTDIATGVAMLMGFYLPKNFDSPYKAQNTQQFWRRWHMTLSRWLRDYLYIPLGGNRKGKLRKALNVMITFTVSGLWHGASWGFVVWGFLNGLFQIIGGVLLPLRQKLARALCLDRESLGYRLGQTLITFVLVDLTWVFFRAPGVRAAVHMIRSMRYIKPEVLLAGELLSPLDAANTHLLLLSLLLLLVADVFKYRGVKVRKVLMEQDWLFQAILISVSAAAILLFGIWGGSYDAASFIYFQF